MYLTQNTKKRGAKKMAKKITTEELYNKLTAAGRTLCEYCENNECECCQVTRLMDDAYVEAMEEGIVEDA